MIICPSERMSWRDCRGCFKAFIGGPPDDDVCEGCTFCHWAADQRDASDGAKEAWSWLSAAGKLQDILCAYHHPRSYRPQGRSVKQCKFPCKFQ